MKEKPLRKIAQTFSIPFEISQDLHTYVKRREMSSFVAEAIRKELELKKEELKRAYCSARTDRGQAEAAEWESTLSDGSLEW